MADGNLDAFAARDAAHMRNVGTFEVDGGDEGPWLLRIGARVQDDRSGNTGTVLSLEDPKCWDDELGSMVSCRPDGPDDPNVIYCEARVRWDKGHTSYARTLYLVPEQDGIPANEGAFFSAAKLKGKPVPPRKWLVQDLIPDRTVTLLGGDGGTGKSLLALQLAVASVTGGAWINNPVAGGPVVYLSAEDDEDELHRRLDDILQATGCDYDDTTNLILCSHAGRDALLATPGVPTGALQPTKLYERLDARMGAVKPALLVLDTLADLFPGNENDRAQARQFIGLLRALAIKHECAVILLAHPSLSGLNSGSGTSGSTGWNNSVRSRLYFERIVQESYEANPDARVLRTMKSNYGRTGGEINLTWRNGVFVADAPLTGLDRMAVNAKAERVFLSLTQMFAEQGRSPSPMLAPKEYAAHPKSEGITKKAFTLAKDTLLDSGKIKIVLDGPPSKQRKRLVVAE